MAIDGALTRQSILLTQGGSGAWDEEKIGPVAILKMGASDYRMWYEGISGTFPNYLTKIGYATSTDGTTWTKYGSNPIFVASQSWQNNEVSVGTVIWDANANVFKLWGHGGNNTGPRQIFYATSSDGLSWTLGNSNNPVVANGGVGTWDAASVADASVIRVSSTDYRMWYLGVNASDVSKVGYATSSDGISWTKYGSNPVFQAGAGGQWDDGSLFGLKILYRPPDPTLHAWYAADDGTFGGPTLTGIGYASSTNGTTWTRGPNNPVLVGTTSPEEWISDPVWAYQDTTSVRLAYYYDDFSVSPTERSRREATITSYIATLAPAAASATASSVAPPNPRPTPPFIEINVRM